MSEDEQKALLIENLVFKLNNLGEQRQAIYDKLWELEEEAKKLRKKLIKAMDHGLKDI